VGGGWWLAWWEWTMVVSAGRAGLLHRCDDKKLLPYFLLLSFFLRGCVSRESRTAAQVR